MKKNIMIILFLLGWFLLTILSQCFPNEWVEDDKAPPLTIIKVQSFKKDTTCYQKVLSLFYGSAVVPLYAQEPFELGEFSKTMFAIIAPISATIGAYKAYKTWQDWNNIQEELYRVEWQKMTCKMLMSTVQALFPVFLLYNIEQDHNKDEGIHTFSDYDMFFAIHVLPLFVTSFVSCYTKYLTHRSRDIEFAHQLLSIKTMNELEAIETSVEQTGKTTLKGLVHRSDIRHYGYLKTCAAFSSTALVASYYLSLSDSIFEDFPKVVSIFSVGIYTAFSMVTFLEDFLSLSMTAKSMMMGLYETWPILSFILMKPQYFNTILLPSALGIGMKMIKSGHEFPQWKTIHPVKYSVSKNIQFIDDDQEIQNKKRSIYNKFKVKY